MNKNEIAILNEKEIEDKVYVIRGIPVMLDRDLAIIYGYDGEPPTALGTKFLEAEASSFIQRCLDEYIIIGLTRCPEALIRVVPTLYK